MRRSGRRRFRDVLIGILGIQTRFPVPLGWVDAIELKLSCQNMGMRCIYSPA